MHTIRVSVLALAALLVAFLGAAIVAGAAPGSALGDGGSGTSAATFVMDVNNSVELRPADGPNGQYASLNADEELEVDFEALNRHGRTRADAVFTVDADTRKRIRVWVESDAADVDFYWGSDPSTNAEDPARVGPDGHVSVGVRLRASDAVQDAEFTVRVDAGGGGLPSNELTLPEDPVQWTVPNAGEPVELSIPLHNDNDWPVTRTISLEVDGVAVEHREVTVQANSRRDVTFEHAFEEQGTYEIGVDGQHVGTVTVQGDSFEVHDAGLSRDVVVPGESVTITANVTNHGDEAGTFRADLTVGGAVVDRQTVRVPAGETVEVAFERTFDRRGGFDVSVAGADAGTVHVDNRAGAAIRRYGSEHGPLLGVLSIPTLGGAIVLGRRHLVV